MGSFIDRNEGRFAREFTEVSQIGSGQFSTVYRAKNKLDGHVYAVKKTLRIVRGSRRASHLNEIFALASVAIAEAGCANIVRYFSSWLEDERLHIQTEFCKCSLRQRMEHRRRKQPAEPWFGEDVILEVLRDVANGLSALHDGGYVHMDIKPDNILLTTGQQGAIVHKIADLGLATAAMRADCDDISEGDCRYLSREVLRGDLPQLPKTDIFSLGLTCYELLTNPKPLPVNGDEWQQLRDGRLSVDLLPPLQEAVAQLVQRMVTESPEERPSSKEVLRHSSIATVEDEALHVEHRRRLEAEEAAEKSRRQASEYFQELVFMKKQELLGAGVGASDVDASSKRPAAGGRMVAIPGPPRRLNTA